MGCQDICVRVSHDGCLIFDITVSLKVVTELVKFLEESPAHHFFIIVLSDVMTKMSNGLIANKIKCKEDKKKLDDGIKVDIRETEEAINSKNTFKMKKSWHTQHYLK